MLSLLVLVNVSQPQLSLTLRETLEGKELLFRDRRGTFSIPIDRRQTVARLSDGRIVRFGDGRDPLKAITVERNGKVLASLDPVELQKKWLQTNSYWGPGKEGNDMRWLNQSGGGIFPVFSEAVKIGNRLLIVIGWRAGGPSGQPIKHQQLAWFNPASSPSITYIRHISLLDEYHYRRPPRLFWRSGKLCLVDPDGIKTISKSNVSVVRRMSSIPPQLGLAGSGFHGRFLLFGPGMYAKTQSHFVLDKRRLTHWEVKLPTPKSWMGFAINFISDQEPTVLFATGYGSSGRQVCLKYDLLGRRSISLKLAEDFHPEALWRNWAISRREGHALLANIKTGKIEARLPLPRS